MSEPLYRIVYKDGSIGCSMTWRTVLVIVRSWSQLTDNTSGRGPLRVERV